MAMTSKKVKIVPESIKYYFIKTQEGHPRITVCLIKMAHNEFYRGISICSPSETNIDKAEGKKKAKKRAIKAYHNLRWDPNDTMPVLRKEAIEVLDDSNVVSELAKSGLKIEEKATWVPVKELTMFEKKLFKIKNV